MALKDPAIRLILWNLLGCRKQKRPLAEGVMADWDVLFRSVVFFKRGGRAHFCLNKNRVEDLTVS